MPHQLQLTLTDGHCRFSFPAMASLCELLLDTTDVHQALTLGLSALEETRRIEQKFSRYREGNPVWQINQSNGAVVTVDDETAALIDFSATLWQLSEGRFDITSGVLREVWRFDGSDNLPTADAVNRILSRIGWQQVRWQRPQLTLNPGMEIDLGGIGKEYAVDKVFDLLREQSDIALLVNFGGDLRAHGPRANGQSWQVGIEQVKDGEQTTVIELTEGGLATSGDARRFLLRDGIRYSHILDPRTGWPVQDAPRSVTTVAPTCVQAGMQSTLAMMMGADAEEFLQQQNIRYWSTR